MEDSKEIWFRRKLYGWGWTPCTWQGWATLLAWVVIVAVLAGGLDYFFWRKIGVLLATAMLIYICYTKGEKPCWQWEKCKDL